MATDRRFLDCLFEYDDLVEIRFLPMVKSAFVKPKDFRQLDSDLEAKNAEGQDIYIGANPRSRNGGKTKDVALARCVFADLDNVSPDVDLQRITDACFPEPTCAVASGHGLHVYWRLDRPMTDLSAWTACQKGLIARLGADPVIHDPPRIMRLPNFTNHKIPPALCKVIDADPTRRYDLRQLIGDRAPVAEKQRSISQDSADSTRSADSATVERIISITQPRQIGQRNACALKLARGLKFDAGLAGTPLTEVKPIVRRWHEKALSVIATKPFDDTWADFVRAWETATTPLLENPVMTAITKARQLDAHGRLPACAQQYDAEPVRLLVGLCDGLGAMRPDGIFFLSSHDVAGRMDLHPSQAWRYLNMLCADGVIELIKRGNQHRASRYRWIGSVDASRWLNGQDKGES